ncbi:DUF3408 domain-containing protein [Myroides odoratus]|nr:DUF3408 domain-containing protein [Myroides odoratus]QQU05517.1 DUF3408 domain-containing protein [Myroides odoratus]
MRLKFLKKLTHIVQAVGENKTSIHAYLYNLLEYHSNEFEQQIITSFNEKTSLYFN